MTLYEPYQFEAGGFINQWQAKVPLHAAPSPTPISAFSKWSIYAPTTTHAPKTPLSRRLVAPAVIPLNTPSEARSRAKNTRLSAKNHLTALRIQLEDDFKFRYGLNGYWRDVSERYTQETGIVHKSLRKTLPKLATEFKVWAEGEGALETGTRNETELIDHQRQWLEFENKYQARLAATKVHNQRPRHECRVTETDRPNMMVRQSLGSKRMRGITPPESPDDILDEMTDDEELVASDGISTPGSSSRTDISTDQEHIQSRAKWRRRDIATVPATALYESITALVTALTSYQSTLRNAHDARLDVLCDRMTGIEAKLEALLEIIIGRK